MCCKSSSRGSRFCRVNKQPPKALQEPNKHRLIRGAETIRTRYIDGPAPLRPSSPGVRRHPCREDTCLLCAYNRTAATPRRLMASALTQEESPRYMRSHRVQFEGTGADEMQARGRAESEGMCCRCPTVHSTSRKTPFCKLPHTSLGCQGNGQQASAVTPHFLCTELSNHDRCRQCHRRRHQGAPPLPARLATPPPRTKVQPGQSEPPKRASLPTRGHLWHVRYCPSFYFRGGLFYKRIPLFPVGPNSRFTTQASGITTLQRVIMFARRRRAEIQMMYL